MSAEPTTNETPRGDDRGLECRACGCRHFFVIETRKAYGGKVMRRRECRHCGKRITTYEAAFGT